MIYGKFKDSTKHSGLLLWPVFCNLQNQMYIHDKNTETIHITNLSQLHTRTVSCL